MQRSGNEAIRPQLQPSKQNGKLLILPVVKM